MCWFTVVTTFHTTVVSTPNGAGKMVVQCCSGFFVLFLSGCHAG